MRVTRRRFLIGFGALLAGFAGLFVVVESILRGGGGSRRAAATGGVPGITSFPTLEVEDVPHVPAEQWVVTVDGLVDKPLRLDHAAWSALTRRSETADFNCVEGWTVDRLRWGGVAPRTILDMAGLQPGASHVNFHALGGTYADSLPLSLVDDAQTLLADTLDEQSLPDAHGGPLRLVVPKQLGYKNVKWVVRLEVTDHPVTGYWERNGYPMDAPVGTGYPRAAERHLPSGRNLFGIVRGAAYTPGANRDLPRRRRVGPPDRTPRRRDAVGGQSGGGLGSRPISVPPVEHDESALAWGRHDSQFRADLRRPFLHRLQAEMCGRQGTRLESAPVVVDQKPHAGRLDHHLHRRPASPRSAARCCSAPPE